VRERAIMKVFEGGLMNISKSYFSFMMVFTVLLFASQAMAVVYEIPGPK
jgi:hypothetical protein